MDHRTILILSVSVGQTETSTPFRTVLLAFLFCHLWLLVLCQNDPFINPGHRQHNLDNNDKECAINVSGHA